MNVPSLITNSVSIGFALGLIMASFISTVVAVYVIPWWLLTRKWRKPPYRWYEYVYALVMIVTLALLAVMTYRRWS